MGRRLLFGLLVAIAPPIGCGRSPAHSAVYVIRTGDYEVEYDGQQKKTTIGPGFVLMVRDPEDILIGRGRLAVGGRDYGEVAAGARILVASGKVAVNGVERRALAP